MFLEGGIIKKGGSKGNISWGIDSGPNQGVLAQPRTLFNPHTIRDDSYLIPSGGQDVRKCRRVWHSRVAAENHCLAVTSEALAISTFV